MSYLERVLSKLFHMEDLTPEQDGSYLLRWTLWASKTTGRRVYLHKIMATDWAREPHDHPKDFTSIGLSGRYTEEIYQVVEDYSFDSFDFVAAKRLVLKEEQEYRAPWFRRFPAKTIHRLRIVEGETCWTLVYTGQLVQPWGFFLPDGTKEMYIDFMKRKFGWSI